MFEEENHFYKGLSHIAKEFEVKKETYTDHFSKWLFYNLAFFSDV
jgi:hypothetical protein